ncbi:3'-5' exonuclease [Bengtsoniella intestinalis]|uniref:ATP-dependent helicase n=1 Tax=Bengtsoniella intestinalis TaxID=3073143 RepID=UPI00391F1A3D
MTEFQQRFITARRAVIERDFLTLNPRQREAVMTTRGPLLLLAGAGSGKTTVLIQRVYNLLTYGDGSDSLELPDGVGEEELAFLEAYPDAPTEHDKAMVRHLCGVHPAAPWEVLAITFTNKAAGELKERLVARLGSRGNDVWAATFHSCCVRMLRRDIDKVGFDKDFTIYDSDDSKRVLKDIIKEMNLDDKVFTPREVLSTISHAKDRYESPAQFAAYNTEDGDWKKARIAKIYTKYADKLRSANALDFDDIIYHTVTLLQQNREVLDYYQTKFRYVLVDEYQDTNHLQYLLTSLLAGGRKNLCVVGDDNQSIYRFRGANIENILSFEKQYKQSRVILLEQNYRSTQHILDGANAVIKHNLGQKDKTLWTQNGAGDLITIKTTFNESDEANYVAGEILMGVNRGRNFRESAVLYRMNAQSNAMEYALKRNGIPYKVVGGTKFFDRAEVKDMLAYLAVVNNPMDDLRLRRIVNTPARGIGGTTMDKVQSIADSQGISLYEVLRNADLFPELKTPCNKLLKMADLIDGLRKSAREMELEAFYEEVCERSGYVKALQDKNDMESRGRIENVEELKSNIVGFLEQMPEDATLSGFLNEIALYTDLDSVDAGDNYVTMMTIHSAKGLEFPNVYVLGLEDGIFPGSSALYQEEELEEERRLCYVAMTRAKVTLTLTNCRQRMLYGRTSANPTSRFLNEIPEDNYQWLSKAEPRVASEWDDVGGFAQGGAATRAMQSGGVVASGRVNRTSGGLGSASANATPMMKLSQGDMVEHTAFGRGMVLSVQSMGGDALIEVAFEKADTGKKKLMLKSAGKHMKKV